MTLALASSMEITPDDFHPPLKRIEATVPGYWTVEELANELGSSTRKILYDITGNTRLGVRPKFQKYRKLGIYYLIPDDDALSYLFEQFKRRS